VGGGRAGVLGGKSVRKPGGKPLALRNQGQKEKMKVIIVTIPLIKPTQHREKKTMGNERKNEAR